MLKKISWLIVGLILALMCFLLVISAKSESRIYDEITYVNAGYHFIINKDFRYDPFNPPFAKEIISIPAIFNKNLINDPILFWPRFVTIIFALMLGIIVFLFAKKLYGIYSGLLALAIFALEPNILANGHFAQADLIFTFFYIFSLYLYFLWRRKLNYKKIFVLGGIFGLLFSTKMTSLLFFLPALLIIHTKNTGIKKILNLKYLKIRLLKICLFVFSLIFFLWSTYFFTFEPMLGYRFDRNRPAINIAKSNKIISFALYQPVPLGSYISTIKQTFIYNYSGLYRKDSMILEKLSRTGQSGLYFIPLIFIKIPWEILFLFFVSLYLFRKSYSKDLILLIPLAVILIGTLLTNVTVVLRYILPVIPLAIIYSSQIINLKHKLKNVFLFLVFVFLISETLSSFPHFVSYINLSLGGYKNGYRYVFDSNYDWGQGLIDLRKYQSVSKINNLKLAYFGDINPSVFRINYKQSFNDSANLANYNVEKMKIDKGATYAISETCWYLCGYYRLNDFKSGKIKDVIGGSILIFSPK
jgi:hypothetical protein